MSEEELRKYYSIYTDCWKLFKKYCEPDGTDDFYQKLIAEAEELMKKMDSHMDFSKKIILDTLDEIDRLGRGKEGNCRELGG